MRTSSSKIARVGCPVPKLDQPILSRSSPSVQPSLSRLMDERENRLSELKIKLNLWEENLTLAEIDQSRMRSELQERMKQANSIKKQWEQSRENLRIERRQIDKLTKSLKSRESAVAARERQAQSTEEALQARQHTMEKVAIDMAEKKVRESYDLKLQTLTQKEIEMNQKEIETNNKLTKEKNVLQKKQIEIKKHQQEYDAAIQCLNKEQELFKDTKLEQMKSNKKTQSAFNNKRKELDTIKSKQTKATIKLKERTEALTLNEKRTQELNDSFVTRETTIQNEQDAIKCLLNELKVQRETDKETHNNHLTIIQQKNEILITEQKQHIEFMESNKIVLSERELQISTSEALNKEKAAHIQVRDQKSLETKEDAQQTLKEVELKQKNMIQERTELDLLMQQLEERRRGLDAMDRHLQAFGEDCEAQREINETVKATMETEREDFTNEMAEARGKIGEENMRLSMEATILEQERSETMGRIQSITATKKNINKKCGTSQKIKGRRENEEARGGVGPEDADETVSVPARGSATQAVRSVSKFNNRKKKRNSRR